MTDKDQKRQDDLLRKTQEIVDYAKTILEQDKDKIVIVLYDSEENFSFTTASHTPEIELIDAMHHILETIKKLHVTTAIKSYLTPPEGPSIN